MVFDAAKASFLTDAGVVALSRQVVKVSSKVEGGQAAFGASEPLQTSGWRSVGGTTGVLSHFDLKRPGSGISAVRKGEGSSIACTLANVDEHWKEDIFRPLDSRVVAVTWSFLNRFAKFAGLNGLVFGSKKTFIPSKSV